MDPSEMNTAASARGKCASRTVWPIVNSLLLFEDVTLGPQNFMNAHFCAHIYKEWRVRSLISQAATCTRIACLECIEEQNVTNSTPTSCRRVGAARVERRLHAQISDAE